MSILDNGHRESNVEVDLDQQSVKMVRHQLSLMSLLSSSREHWPDVPRCLAIYEATVLCYVAL